MVIFLFSVFPSGPSTGLAYAAPGVSGAVGAISNIMGFMGQIMGRGQSNQAPNAPSYGSITHQNDNQYFNKDVSGSVSFGSNTVQENNQWM